MRRRVTPKPMSASTISPPATTTGARPPTRLSATRVRKRSSTPGLRSRAASASFGGRSIERTAGITVISMIIVASTPHPAKMPKCCTIGMPVPASDRKVMTAMSPATIITGPTRTIDSTTASRLASRGAMPDARSRPYSS